MLRGSGPAQTESRAVTSVPWSVGAPSMTSVTQERALRLIPVYAAVRLVADLVSTLPLKSYRETGDERQPMSRLPQLFQQMDDAGALLDWLHRCMTSLLLRGNAYGLVTARDGMQFPTVIQWLNPDQVYCDDRNPWAPVWYWNGRVVPTEDMVHIPWFTVAGKVQGLSPIEAYATTVNVGLQAQSYASGWFDNGGVPPGTFKNTAKTVTTAESDEIKDRLVRAIQSRKPIVYGSDWDYNPISISPEQAQFVETARLTASQIAAIYGVPPEMIGGEKGGSYTYSSPEQNALQLATLTLRPWLVKLERKFSSLLPMRQQVRFNADAIVRADLMSRMNAYKVAKDIGLRNLDELRALEDLPPLPNGQGQTFAPAPQPQPAARKRSGRLQARHLPGQHNQESHGHGGARSVLDSIGSDGFDAITTVDGTFGELGMGVDTAGDVRIAFHEGRDLRELDLSSDELAELGDILERIAESRDDLPGDAENADVYDDDRFGSQGDHKVELYGSGIIGVIFGADDPDPYTLMLDPPDDDTDDVQAVLDAIGDVLNEVSAERAAPRRKRRVTDPRRAVLSLYARELGDQRFKPHEARHLPGQHNQESHGNDSGNLVKKLRALDGKSLHLNGSNGRLSIRIPFDEDDDPDRETGSHFDTITLDRDTVRDFAEELQIIEEQRVDYLRKARSVWNRLDKLEDSGRTDSPEYQQALAEWEAIGGDGQRIAGGELDGESGQLVYELRMGSEVDDTSFLIGIRPPDADDDWDLNETASDLAGAFLTHSQFRQLRKQIDGLTGETADARSASIRARNDLKKYWLHGEGASQWSTFDELYDHLKKHVPPAKAKRIAAAWFHARYGYWPGSDKNRVAHGKKPRGKRVGPG